VNEFRKGLGLSGITRFFEKWIHSPQLNLGLFPDWFAPPQRDWPENTHLTGFIPHQLEEGNLSEETMCFIQDGEAPLVFTAGTAMLHTKDFFETAVLATQILKKRAILLSRLKDQIPANLPENIYHAEFEPLDKLLSQSAAFIYHGGIGSLAQGLAAGVPHLTMPMSLDQPDNAARIRRLGVGDYILPRGFNPRLVSEKLTGLLKKPIVGENCLKYAKKVDFHKSILDTCNLLENFSHLLK
jgi:rhamnosyltransferase subunit B